MVKVARKSVSLPPVKNAKSLKTLLNHPEMYHVYHAVKLGDYNVGRKEALLTLPYYMAFLLDEL